MARRSRATTSPPPVGSASAAAGRRRSPARATGYAGRTGSSPRGGLTDQALGENNRGTGGKASPQTGAGSGFGLGDATRSTRLAPIRPSGSRTTIPGKAVPSTKPATRGTPKGTIPSTGSTSGTGGAKTTVTPLTKTTRTRGTTSTGTKTTALRRTTASR